MNPTSDRYCWTDSTCIRACIHSGPHLPGCRNCHTEDHSTANCTEPPTLDHTEETMRPEDICAQQLCDCRENERPCALEGKPPRLAAIADQDAKSAGREAALRVLEAAQQAAYPQRPPLECRTGLCGHPDHHGA